MIVQSKISKNKCKIIQHKWTSLIDRSEDFSVYAYCMKLEEFSLLQYSSSDRKRETDLKTVLFFR